MPPENEPSHPEILTLRERLGSVERDVREVDHVSAVLTKSSTIK
jgi:hypothetical protein